MINQKNGYFGIRSFCVCKPICLLVKGDSPLCGEMSRNDRGDGRRLGAIVFLPLRG